MNVDDDLQIGAIDLLRKMAFLHSDGIQKDLFQVRFDTLSLWLIARKRPNSVFHVAF
jgi:hypothetical protein